MAGYDAFDPRLESLVVETLTKWGPDAAGLGPDDKLAVSRAIHAHPELASHIVYERTHTGFIREITVSASDIEKLYQQNFSQGKS